MPKRHKKHHPNLHFSIRGGLLLEKESPKLDFEGLRTDFLCSFEFYRTAIEFIIMNKKLLVSYSLTYKGLRGLETVKKDRKMD